MIYSNGRPVSDLGQSGLLAGLGKGHFLGIPVPVWILLIVFFIFLFILQKTVFGRQVYAVGCNPKAAALAGISTGRVTYLVYVISGAAAAVAGLILVSRLGSAQPTVGSGYELDAIAAVALGGTSMSDGRGRHVYRLFYRLPCARYGCAGCVKVRVGRVVSCRFAVRRGAFNSPNASCP